jgi:hypothetical protein
MATEVKRRRGTTAQHSLFTGALGEVTVDTDKDTLVVHDDSQVGGYPLLREDFSNVPQLITFYEANVKTLNFDTTYSDTGDEPQGGLYWNLDEKTLSLVTNGSTLELGHKTEVNVINNDPLQNTIEKGSVVSAYGSPGASGKISVKLFEAGTDDTKTILGILDEDIDYGFEGKAIVFGKIRKIDTGTPNWSAGDVLYASSTAGQLTNVQPTAGNVELPIAYVVTVHPNVGEIFVRITPIDENAYQPYDADLSTLSGLSKADGNFIVGNGSAWVAESGATVRTSLGLGNVENVALSTYTGQGGALDNQYILNGAGYITGYTETDTLSDVTGRGASTTDTVTIDKSSASTGYAFVVSGSSQESIRFLHTGLTIESTGTFNIDAGASDDQDMNLNAGHIYLNNNTDVDGNLGVTGNVTGGNLAISNWNEAHGWGDHSLAGYLTSLPTHNHDNLYYRELEINEFFDGTNPISGYKKSDWDTAFGWGNHASVGYLTSVPSEYLTQTEGDARYLQLTGGTVTGDINIQKDNPTLKFTDTTTSNPSNQTTQIRFEGIDSSLPANEGLGLIIETTDATGTDLTPCLIVSGQIYSNNLQKVFDDSYHPNADKLTTSREIILGGDLVGSAFFDGSSDITILAQVSNNSHTHDDRYYTESEVNNLLSNKDNYQSWTIADDGTATTLQVGSGNTLNIVGGTGITSTLSGSTLTISATNNGDITGVTAGSGLSGGGTSGTVELSHADTSSQASVNNSNGTVIQDVTLDTYGHVTGLVSYNLDGRYYTETESDGRYLRSNADDTGTGQITLQRADDTPLVLRNTGNGGFVGVEFSDNSSGSYAQKGTLRYCHSDSESQGGGASFHFGGTEAGLRLIMPSDGAIKVGTNTVFHDGYHPNADKLTTSREIELTGDVTGSVFFDGSGDVNITTSVANDSHTHDGRYYTETEVNNFFGGTTAITGYNKSDWDSAYNNTVASTSFNTGTGVLTLTQNDGGTLTVDLDGRYLTSETGDISEVVAGTGLSGGGTSGSVTLDLDFSELPSNPPVSIDTTDQLIWYETGSGTENRTDISSFPLSKFNNDSGWTSNVGDITAVTAGTGLSGGGTSGSVSLAHASTSTLEGIYGNTADGTKIDTITVDAFGHVTAVTTGAVGDITGVTAGTGLSGGGTSGTVTLNLDFSELTDMTADVSGTTELILQNGTIESRKAISEVKLSAFNNDSGWTSNVGDITGVTAGTGLSGGGTSGTVTLNVSGLTTSQFSAATLLNSAEAFSSSDAIIMTSAAIESYVTGLGYTTNIGDITGVTAGSGISGGGTSGTVTISHADTSSQGSVNNSDGTVIQDVTLDTYGHVTGLVSYNLDGRYYTESEADGRFVNVTGDTMSGDLTISGTLSATVKSFNIEHPTQEGKRLVYGVLEGNEHAVFVRGKSQCKCIELPEEWTGLVDPESITVQLTSIGNAKNYYFKEYKDNKIYIGCSGLNWKYNYFYIVHATRIDVKPLQTVQNAN